LNRRYQRTATTITSGGNRNPANADFGGDHGQGRAGSFTIKPASIIQSANATEPLYVLGVRGGTQPDQAKNASDDHERQCANHHDSQRATNVSALVTALMLNWHPTRPAKTGRW
jgi:hypothetical protein